MRHVTDGELHAYLDGGLDAFPDDRASEIRRHVDRCAACASRLDEARAIRNRAGEILGMAAPDVADAPALEELRRLASTAEDTVLGGGGGEAPAPAPPVRVEDRTTSGGPLGRSSLRWAATVLVALGAGWLWGIAGDPGVTPSAPPAGERSASSEDTATEGVGGPAVADRASAVRRAPGPSSSEPSASEPSARDRAGESGARSPEPVERSARTLADARDAARSAEMARAEGARGTPLEEAAARERDDAPEGAVRTSGDPSLGDRLAVGWVPLADAAPRAAHGIALPDSVPALHSEERLAGRTADASLPPSGWPSMDSSGRDGRPLTEVLGLRRDVAGALGGARSRANPERPTPAELRVSARRPLDAGIDPGSLTVPGLDVVSVEWTRVAPETTGIRVVQRLVTGGTIELRFGGLTDGAAPPEYLREERLPEGLHQVVADFRDGWLVARAPLEPEQIRALVALIR